MSLRKKQKRSLPFRWGKNAFRYRLILFTLLVCFCTSLAVFLPMSDVLTQNWQRLLAGKLLRDVTHTLESVSGEAASYIERRDNAGLSRFMNTVLLLFGDSAGLSRLSLIDVPPGPDTEIPLENSGSRVRTEPLYDSSRLSYETTSYVFYVPVVLSSGARAGMLRMDVSVLPLLEQVDEGRSKIMLAVILGSFVFSLLASAAASIFSSFIFNPIRQAVTSLKNPEAAFYNASAGKVNSLDEIIYYVSRDLLKAGVMSRELKSGRDVQKKLLPLDIDATGRKKTFGSLEDAGVSFFGYYEGADGVSGDYFDYVKLDNCHYAVIKCDVAGKGVPAALIMMEVAALFRNYCRDWSYDLDGYNLVPLVSRINDLIETSGFSDRFVAFTLGLLNVSTGVISFCNAGDNLVHIFDAESKKMKTLTLPEVSAAGVFPSFVIERRGGFKVVQYTLSPGDVLFLYTDGLEESRPCSPRIHELSDPSSICAQGMDSRNLDMLGAGRIHEVLEAVFSHSRYSLKKYQDSEEFAEELQFDFSACAGSPEDAVTALAAVEKIFRICRCPNEYGDDFVRVDRKIADFLSICFTAYHEYFGTPVPELADGEYVYFKGLTELPQYDDLAILAVKKK